MLYLVRHAAAEDLRAGRSDEERVLTPEGIRKFRRAARGIVRLVGDMPPEIILTSPLVRARQTAALLVEAFDAAKVKTELCVSAALGPPGSLDKLRKEARAQDTMAVGHEPMLSEWIGEMCFGHAGELEMKKGALAAVELETGGRGRLVFLVQPGVLREL
jgi:phosphohistidine phosphatase